VRSIVFLLDANTMRKYDPSVVRTSLS
jgi:hypothetical protein